MPGPSVSDERVYTALKRPEFFPDEFKTWLPRYLHYLADLKVAKNQIPGIMGENWHEIGSPNEPAFQNGWVNYGGSFATAAFYKDFLGIVHLKGLVKSGTIAAVAFVLPAGYRPVLYSHFPAASNDAYATLRVDATGGVQLGAPGSNTWFSIDGITFRAA